MCINKEDLNHLTTSTFDTSSWTDLSPLLHSGSTLSAAFSACSRSTVPSRERTRSRASSCRSVLTLTTVESPGLQDADSDEEDVDEMECDADSSSESFGGGVNYKREGTLY